MILAHPLFNKIIEFKENVINTLIIENAIAFRSMVNQLLSQSVGEGGEFVLSQNNELLEFSKKVEVVTDHFCLDFSSRRFASKVNAEAYRVGTDNDEQAAQILTRLNLYGSVIVSNLDFNASFTPQEDVGGLIKLLNFTVECIEMTIPEKVLEYMKVCRGFFGKELFIFVNLKSCLSKSELELFCKSIGYEKLNILLVESFQKEHTVKNESVYIIDTDLCEI